MTKELKRNCKICPITTLGQDEYIDCLEEQYEELEKENERAKVLLKATLDLLQKQKESHYVLNLLENTVFYDNAECDGYCLFDDIENFFELLEKAE